MAGNAGSNSGDVLGFYGNSDFWFAKLSPTGAVQWQKRVGGSASDSSSSSTQSTDGGFVMAESTRSINSINGNSAVNNGSSDVLLVKFTAEILSTNYFNQNELVLHPNPTQDFLYLKSPSNVTFDRIEIIDTTGKVLIQQKDKINTVNVQNLESGVYLIYSYSNEKKYINKFIKK